MTLDEKINSETNKIRNRVETDFSKIKAKVEESANVAPEFSQEYKPKTIESELKSNSTQTEEMISEINSKMNVQYPTKVDSYKCERNQQN